MISALKLRLLFKLNLLNQYKAGLEKIMIFFLKKSKNRIFLIKIGFFYLNQIF